VWDARTGAAVAHFSARLAISYGVLAAWSPNGKAIATVSDEPSPERSDGGQYAVSRVHLWDAESGALRATLPGSALRLRSLSFSPEGTQVRALAATYTVSVFDPASGKKLAGLRGHVGPVGAVSASPDGAMVATASADGAVRIWDAATWVQIAEFAGKVDPRTEWVSWGPGRPRVSAAGRDGRVRVWDALSGAEQMVLPPRVSDLPDGSSWAPGLDGITRPYQTTRFFFSPTGTRGVVATDGWGGGTIDLRPARLELRSPGHVGGLGTAIGRDAENRAFREPIVPRVLAWGSNGSRLWTGGKDGTVRIWDGATGKPLPVVWRHGGPVTAVALSPNGSRVLSASADGTARVRDARDGTAVASLVGHTGAVTSAAFSPDGLRVVTTSRDGTARVWLANSGEEVRALRYPTVGADHSFPLSAAWAPDGRRIAVGRTGDSIRGGPVLVWDVGSGRVVAKLGAAKHVSWSPNGSRILTFAPGQHSGPAVLWALDADHPRQVSEPMPDESRTAVAWNRDGSRYLLASDTGLAIRDGKSGKPLGTLELPDRADWGPSEASFDPSGTRVLWRTGGGLQIWNLETRKREVVFRYPQAGGEGRDAGVVHPTGAEWSPDGNRVATGHADGTARVWDAATGEVVAVMERSHTGNVAGSAWSPDGAWVLTAEVPLTDRETGNVVPPGRGWVWDARTGKPVRGVPADGEGGRWPDGTPIRVAPTLWRQQPPEGRAQTEVLATSGDGSRELFVRQGEARQFGFAEVLDAEIRDPATKTVLALLRGHAGAVFAASFSPDGSRVATWARDRTIRVWHAATGAELLVLRGEADGLAGADFRFVSWSPDGHRILTAALGRGVTILDATPLGR
jgi:WD40 repeat protein